MKGTNFLLSFWLSVATFCLLQIFFGPGGISETVKLREQNLRLESRLTALRAENARLTTRYEALRTSSEAVRLEARALGYFRRGETPVRTLGGAEFRLPSEETDLSSVPPLADGRSDSSWFFRIALPLLFFVYSAMFHLIVRLWPRDAVFRPIRRGSGQNLPVPVSTGLDFFHK